MGGDRGVGGDGGCPNAHCEIVHNTLPLKKKQENKINVTSNVFVTFCRMQAWLVLGATVYNSERKQCPASSF